MDSCPSAVPAAAREAGDSKRPFGRLYSEPRLTPLSARTPTGRAAHRQGTPTSGRHAARRAANHVSPRPRLTPLSARTPTGRAARRQGNADLWSARCATRSEPRFAPSPPDAPLSPDPNGQSGAPARERRPLAGTAARRAANHVSPRPRKTPRPPGTRRLADPTSARWRAARATKRPRAVSGPSSGPRALSVPLGPRRGPARVPGATESGMSGLPLPEASGRLIPGRHRVAPREGNRLAPVPIRPGGRAASDAGSGGNSSFSSLSTGAVCIPPGSLARQPAAASFLDGHLFAASIRGAELLAALEPAP